MHSLLTLPALLFCTASLASDYLRPLPSAFKPQNESKWAWISYESPSVAVLPGSFNRSVFEAPYVARVSDGNVKQVFDYINGTDFVAYDSRFFDIIGPNASVEHLHNLPYQTHEAPCWIPSTGELFFVEWGPPGGENGTHNWQYLLNTHTNTLRKIQTNPPTTNAHGCVVYKNHLYVVTDGTHNETGALVRIDPATWTKETILNNYYAQPFLGLNDLDIDPQGNFWLTDSKTGYGRHLIPYYYPTNPSVYFVNGTTGRPRVVHVTTGNANGVAVSGDGKVYIPDTGVSESYPADNKNPFGDRRLHAFDTGAGKEGLLENGRLLANPIAYYYDGIRVARNGWIFAGAGDGVDVLDPETGLTLGTIRMGGGRNLAVNIAFGGEGGKDMWIVGRGGVWVVKGVREELTREW